MVSWRVEILDCMEVDQDIVCELRYCVDCFGFCHKKVNFNSKVMHNVLKPICETKNCQNLKDISLNIHCCKNLKCHVTFHVTYYTCLNVDRILKFSRN